MDDLGKLTTWELVLRCRSGCQLSFERLLVIHRYLIESMAFSLVRHFPRIDFDDAIQAGRIGLWNAVNDFKNRKGANLGTHAHNRIRTQHNYLRRALDETDNDSFMSVSITTETNRIRRNVKTEMTAKLKKRYRAVLRIIARLAPARIAALRERFGLTLPGPEVRLSDCSAQVDRYFMKALTALKAEAASHDL